MQADSFPRWVGDVGGTNARFALQLAPGAELTSIDTLLLPTRSMVIA